jgi:hypothetical protein
VKEVLSDGTYVVRTPTGERTMNPETDIPLQPGQQVWFSDVWTPATYDLATGVHTPGRLTPGHLKPVIHGPRYE